MTSTTAMSTKWLRDHEFLVHRVEYWHAFSHRRIDLYNVIDLVALRKDIRGVLGIQATTATNLSSHRVKCRASAALRLWLECGNPFEIHAWARQGPRGKRKVWTLTREVFTVTSLNTKIMLPREP